MILKTDNLDEIRKIRTRIFHTEMGLSKNDIFDNDDKVLDQFLILHEQNTIGTFRLREEEKKIHKIERMGILPEFRLRGFGQLTLEEIKTYSKNLNKSKIILDSIYDVRNFYAKSGFCPIGKKYSKVGIPHIKMYFRLI